MRVSVEKTLAVWAFLSWFYKVHSFAPRLFIPRNGRLHLDENSRVLCRHHGSCLFMKNERRSAVTPLKTATIPLTQNSTNDVSFPVASEGTIDDFVRNPPNQISVWQGRLLVWIAAAIYGTNFAVVKLMEQQDMSLSASAAVRFTIAAIACTAGTLAVRQNNYKGKQAESVGTNMVENWLQNDISAAIGGAETGAWYWAGYLCQAYGLQSVDAGKSAFLNALAVVVVPVLDCLFEKKDLKPSTVTSIGMAVGGMALLEWGHTATSLILGTTETSAVAVSSDSPVGLLFCLGQALMFGIGYWRLESISARFPDKSDVVTVFQLWGIAAGSIFYWLLFDSSSIALLQQWLSNSLLVTDLLWTGLISTALALYMETVALTAVTATELTLIMTSIGVFGSLFAYLTLGEVLSWEGMLGGVLIVLACILTARSTD